MIVWPDADAPGQAYADEVIRLVNAAGARSVARVEVPATVSVGWDAADAEGQGWSPEQAGALIKCALSAAREMVGA